MMILRNYKYLLLIWIGALCNLNVDAQQKPQYTQYIFNNYLLNPALSGSENYIDAKIGHRTQWTGIKNAPKTSFISAHWSLSEDYLWANPLSLPESGGNPMERSYVQNYSSSPSHSGMGVMAVIDKAGPLSRLDGGVSYAYHLQLSGTKNLAVGAYAGASRLSLDVSELTLEDSADPALSNVVENRVKPDLSVGIWYYDARLFGGLSVQQVIPQSLSFTNASNYNKGKTAPHFFLTAGYRTFIDDDISLTPSFMIKHVSGLPTSIDFNAKISFKNNFWVGGSYRTEDSFSAMAGFNIKNFANLTYAYDLTTSALNVASNGSHEIVLGFQLNNVYEVFSGGRTWR